MPSLHPPIVPMLATLTDRVPAPERDYAIEFKWDGYRALCFANRATIRFQSRTGNDLTPYFGELAPLKKALGNHDVILDGEIVAQNADGRIDFHALQVRMGLEEKGADFRDRPAKYLLFDILYLDGKSLIDRPYVERRKILEKHFKKGPFWDISFYSTNHAADMLAAARRNGIEGVMAKRLDSLYYPGKRTRDWLKIKFTLSEEFVIGGWIPGQGYLAGRFGTLLMGYYASKADARNERLTFAGGVGTGFNDAMRLKIQSLLDARARAASQFIALPRGGKIRSARFVKPDLVGEVEFREWTPFKIMRAPAFKGLRFDKKPVSIILDPSGLSGPG
jgi:bifunctional non-homologous end joining protein LigD